MLSMLRGPAGVFSRRWISPLERSTATIAASRSAVTSASAVPPRRRAKAGGTTAERERCCGGCEELATVHVVSTSRPARGGPGTLSGASGVEVVTPPTGGRPCSGCSHPHSSRSRSSRAPPWLRKAVLRPESRVGWDGTVDSSGAVRYVALPAAKTTTIAAVRTSDGRVLRYGTIRGGFGIPLVAFDGTAEGVSRDGTTLVLADVAAQRGARRASPSSARRRSGSRRRSRSPAAGRTTPCRRTAGRSTRPSTSARARTRAIRSARSASSAASRSAASLVDEREPDEEMNGSPWARVRSANGAWAYTLYAKPNGTGFVHALDTARRRAFCVDLPWRTSVAAPRRRAPVARERRSHARAGEAAAGPGSPSSTRRPSR